MFVKNCVSYKTEVSCNNVAQNVDGKKLSEEKCGAQEQNFLPLCSDSEGTRLKIVM